MDLEAERTRIQAALVEVQSRAALAQKQADEQVTGLRYVLAELDGIIKQDAEGVAAAEALCRICAP